jgi:hypothetical protein
LCDEMRRPAAVGHGIYCKERGWVWVRAPLPGAGATLAVSWWCVVSSDVYNECQARYRGSRVRFRELGRGAREIGEAGSRRLCARAVRQ